MSVLTDTVDVKDYIKKIKKRDLQLNSNWGTICPLVEMEAADGKRRKTQAADTKGLTENKKAAKLGGDVAGNALKELEAKTGKRVISSSNYKALEEKKQKKLK